MFQTLDRLLALISAFRFVAFALGIGVLVVLLARLLQQDFSPIQKDAKELVESIEYLNERTKSILPDSRSE